MFDTSNWELAMSRPPDRLIRFVDDDLHTGPLVCAFDPAKNILRIRREYYNLLKEEEQKIVWRSTASLTFEDIANIVHQRHRR